MTDDSFRKDVLIIRAYPCSSVANQIFLSSADQEPIMVNRRTQRVPRITAQCIQKPLKLISPRSFRKATRDTFLSPLRELGALRGAILSVCF